MNMISEFIEEYGSAILYALVTAIFGYFGMALKNMVQEYINDKFKTDAAIETVNMVEQVYKDLHGEEKFEKAKMYFVDALEKKGISTSELEVIRKIEAAVKKINDDDKKKPQAPEENHSDENVVENDAPTNVEEYAQDEE